MKFYVLENWSQISWSIFKVLWFIHWILNNSKMPDFLVFRTCSNCCIKSEILGMPIWIRSRFSILQCTQSCPSLSGFFNFYCFHLYYVGLNNIFCVDFLFFMNSYYCFFFFIFLFIIKTKRCWTWKKNSMMQKKELNKFHCHY